MEFEVKGRKRGSISTTVQAQVPGWNMFLTIDNKTGKVPYPVTIGSMKGRVGIRLDAPSYVTVEMPDFMDKDMLNKTARQAAEIPAVVAAARKLIEKEQDRVRELIEKEQDRVRQDRTDAAAHTVSMPYDRCMELLNQIINHTSTANNTSGTVRELLYMGFEADELTTFFDFGRDDVDSVAKEMEEEYEE